MNSKKTPASQTPPWGAQTPVSQTPDLEGLREFATKTGRVDPPAFVGRTKIIENFVRDLRTRTREWRYRPKGKPREGEKKNAWKGAWKSATWLFQGAPGAGKTALISQLEPLTVPKKTWLTRTRLALALGKNTERPVQVCQINNLNILEDMWELQKKIAGTWIPGAEKEMEARRMLEMGVSLEVAHGKEQTEKTLMSWEDVVKKVTGNPGEYPPMLMMMDEAQAINHKAGKQLLWLHQGNDGLPIVPVFGGLAWTRKHFKSITPVLSRIDGNRAITLEALPEEDCREAVHRFFEKYQIIASPQAKEKWAQAIADDCMGWPQHLHFSLQGMALALIAPDVDGNLDRADLEKARQYAEEQRNDYYSDRLDSKELERKDILVAHGAKACNPDRTTTPFALAKVIHEASEKAGGAGTMSASALPEGMSATQFVDVMERAGILHEYRPVSKTTGKPLPLQVKIPIPSFRTYLLDILESPTEPEDQHDQNLAPSQGF